MVASPSSTPSTIPRSLRASSPSAAAPAYAFTPAYLAEDQEGIRDPGPWNQAAVDGAADYTPEVRDIVTREKLEVGPAVAYNDMTACDQFDIMDRVSEIKLPTLAICGTEDVMTPVVYSKYLEKNLDNCRTVIIEGATHSVLLERPDIVNPAIEEFISGLG